ncbi:hypothetical protein A2917_02125 [Candidatus Nomurabacteria bacterium RIFCSPLOWO2_01_FULL_42_17]|uniref:tRNA pseudouridine(55) synthase n=1 Tax=Candidatus Nomurabacteria bacterium RIFCSPLOWO2_01_FULL_42_17 TaxID=1801780 RepID=A0A1F6XMR1_9BACT|nr:MAG: hypothetical protein A2917_02125 [Candidatus Nomurabacteria bacterium RIFCSPLOWO2_01_FULL_42_17]
MKKFLKKILLLNKKEGETPLEALQAFRAKNKKYKDAKMTYAGRLDPLASGLLLVLAGDAVKEKEKYLKLSKEYKFSVLFGFTTDTYDILGKIQHSNILTNIGMKELEKKIKQNLKFFTGKFMQSYPMYSSRTVKGKPLFAYARAGKFVESPKHEVEVKSLKFFCIKKISARKFLENIERRVVKVKGDFRQKEILKIWRQKLKSQQGESLLERKFFIADFNIKCSSGTYVRGIAHSLGQKLNIPALAFSIKRTKIGKWEQSE